MEKENKIFKERLKFYADTPQDRNKYFCFEIVSVLSLKDALWRFFDKGWNVRAAYYERINIATGEIEENTKLKVDELMNEYLDTKLIHQKKKNLY